MAGKTTQTVDSARKTAAWEFATKDLKENERLVLDRAKADDVPDLFPYLMPKLLAFEAGWIARGDTAPAVTQEEEHDPWVYLPCGRHNDHSAGCSDCQRVRQSEYILKRQREVAKAICKRPDVTRPVKQGSEDVS